MWFSAVRTVGVGCSRVLAGRRAACVILGRKQEPLRITTLVACLHGKDSAFSIVLGVNREKPAEESITPQAPAVSSNKADQKSLLQNAPDQPEKPKILKIAIIGAPNAGKSTLSNHLLGRKLFPVSSKVHTTRCQAQGVITEGDTQMLLLDTPGMVTAIKAKRHRLDKSIQEHPWESVKLSDVVIVLVDVSVRWMRSSLHSEVLKCLSENPTIPSILVLNKVDLLKDKSALLGITEKLTEGIVKGKKANIKIAIKGSPKITPLEMPTFVDKEETECNSTEQVKGSVVPDHKMQTGGWAHFQDVFMLSAIRGDEVETLKKYLMTLAKPGEWLFHSGVVTTQSPQEICDNIVREKLLEYLPLEIPYGITQVTHLWEEGFNGELVIKQTLLTARENHVKIIIGSGGHLIKRITQEAGQDLMNAFLCDVRLRLVVKFKK